MSIPPQISGSVGSKGMEDCRDYLRTGRCKYGASCKYNHPSNVLNGGGLKPLDPSEPLFPSRPSEPICQYFLKHGTCKFGQACKFDHPAQSPGMQVISIGGGGVPVQMMNVTQRGSSTPPTPLVLNPGMGGEANGMVLQFLPQRVDEPDCIYFLKNGRCKYGATCRYHHPIQGGPSRRIVSDNKPPRRQLDPYNRSGQNVQYVAQMVQSYSSSQSVPALGSHYDNGAVTYVNIDGSNRSSGPAQSYQIVTGSDGVTSYCIPTGSVVVTEQGSAASSIASSFEASQELLTEQWNRARRNGSGSSLSGGQINEVRPPRVYLSHSVSEGNMIQRQARSTSYGSAGEMHSTSSLSRNVTAGTWNQRMQTSQYPPRQDPNTRSPNSNHLQQRFVRRRDPRGDGHDEGFTMMTSALLNMLDTPDEAAGESYSDEEYRYPVADHYGDRYRPSDEYEQEQLDYTLFQQMSLHDRNLSRETLHEEVSSYVDQSSFQKVSANATYLPLDKLSPSSGTNEETQTAETGQSWSPTWLGAVDGPDDAGYAFSLAPPNLKTHPPPASTSSHDTDVGLYLP